MAERRVFMRDGLFWGLTAAVFAGTFGAAIAFVVAEVAGEGWRSGVFVGGAIFLVAAYVLARAAVSPNLPPPNTLKAPTAPPGGAFRAPAGGSKRWEAVIEAPPAPSEPASERVEAAATTVEKAAFAASAAVTNAAQAAKAAIEGVLDAPRPAQAAEAGAIEASKPAALSAPRDGGADDLKKIKGVGPKLEELLHSLGYYHFDQIAAWTPAEIAWVDANLEGFNGRATRDDWVGQAKLLARGGETEFSERVDKGDVY